MSYESFFTGVGGIVLGTLIGSWISCRMTYGFQKQLLYQQLEFQKKQADIDFVQRDQIHTAQLKKMNDLMQTIDISSYNLRQQLSGTSSNLVN